MVSELVTDSVVYGGGGFVPTARGDREIGGWGLELVEKLSAGGGVREGSTHIWSELRQDADQPS